MEDYLIKEEDVLEQTFNYFSNELNFKIKKHPDGNDGVDIGGKSSDGRDVFIEVKGTLNKNNQIAKQQSNGYKLSMAYGIYQLITRVKKESDIAILLLPYHRFFISRVDKIGFGFKKLNFKLFFLYKDGKIKEYTL